MCAVLHRRGEPSDVPAAAELFVESMVDLCRRNGITVTPPPSSGMEPWYRHLRATGIFEIAEDDGAMVAFASGIVRDGRFFLSMFWTRPALQRKGIGRPLLARVWDEAARAGARSHSVWSSIDYAALGTYLRVGMRPIGPILTFGGEPKKSVVLDVELAPLAPEVAGRIDRGVLGTERPMDHAFFPMQRPTARVVREGERVLGYFYAHEGRIGPVAWDAGVDGRRVLAAAIETARRDAPSVGFAVPGQNRVAIDLAVELGLTIQGTSHFLASEPFGALERYVPSGPALF